MTKSEVFTRIQNAIDAAPRNGYVAEMHVQVIKYAQYLDGVSGREFCSELGLKSAWGTEFSKMKKIAPRLLQAGLNPDKI
ncbi:MAG: transcription factor [Sphingopyxis sp.]